MAEVSLTWSRVFRVWWAIFWRSCLISFAFGLVLLAVVVIYALATGMSIANSEAIDNSRWLQLLFFLLGAVAALLATKDVLGKPLGTFRIALVSRSESSAGDPST
jgi:hypothetical protein